MPFLARIVDHRRKIGTVFVIEHGAVVETQLARQVQTEPGALARGRVERLEQVGPYLLRDRRTVVLHMQFEARARDWQDIDADAARLPAGIAQCIREQVQQYFLQMHAVKPDPIRADRRHPDQLLRHAVGLHELGENGRHRLRQRQGFVGPMHLA